MTLIWHRFRAFHGVVLLVSLLVVAIGVSVLIGWAFDIAALKTVFPGLVTMKANTALGLLLCGLALAPLLLENMGPTLRFCIAALAGAVIALGSLTLGEYFFGWNLGIDELLFRDAIESVGTSQPGRMAPSTAFCFVMTGSALVVASQRILLRLRFPIVSALGATLIVIAGVGSLGQITNGLLHVRLWNYFGMAVHTAVGFMLLGAGLLAHVRNEKGMTWTLDMTTTIGFATAVAIMLTAAGVSWNYTNQLEKAATWVGHTQEVLKEIEEVRAGMADLESSQRGYIITGDERLLEQRTEIKDAVREDLDALRRLTADNFDQQHRLDELDPLIVSRTGFGEQTIIARRAQGFSAAQQMIATDTGIRLTENINRLLLTMRDDQYGLLVTRQKQVNAISTATFLLLPVGVFLSLTILSLALFFLNAGVGEQAQAEEKLKASLEEVTDLQDALEQRVAERTSELETANKELEAFSYSVSHDLRSPLRAVDGFSQAVLEDYGAQLPEEGRRYLRTIREGAQRMGVLIDDLLTFSRLSRTPLNKQEVNTGDLVRRILEGLNSEQEDRQVEIRIGELPDCQGDRALLNQVWVNLLSNALKYTRQRQPAVIEIGCKLEQDESVYFVRDNGAGFDMRYAPKLFGVFQRLHRVDEFEGTGVGLAIVQRIIHRHGGRIWADAALNRGATFYFTLKEKAIP